MPGEIEAAQVETKELPKEIEWAGQKYNPTELLEAFKEYSTHKEDIKNLDKLKENNAAFEELSGIINANPELTKQVRVTYGRKLAGLPFDNPPEKTPEEIAAQVPPETKGGKAAPAVPQIPNELLERIENTEKTISALSTAEAQKRFNTDLMAFQAKYPSFKDEARMKELYSAGRQLAVAKMGEFVSMGTEPQKAWSDAQAIVGNMTHEQIMMLTPMRSVYEEQILKAAGGRPGLPGGIGTGAERLNAGQPGPTPELDEQLRKEITAAGLDNDRRRAAIEKWATHTGRHPLELYGFDAATARQLAPV